MSRLRPGLRRLMPMRSYLEVERMRRSGEISEADYRGYLHVWRWCNVRFSGVEGLHHDVFIAAYGVAGYVARINRVRAACGFPMLSR